MIASKITEVTIYESPDGGRTIYARRPGETQRRLHWEDPELIKERQELEEQRRWIEIHSARRDNSALNSLCEQVELLYELSKKSK